LTHFSTNIFLVGRPYEKLTQKEIATGPLLSEPLLRHPLIAIEIAQRIDCMEIVDCTAFGGEYVGVQDLGAKDASPTIFPILPNILVL